MNNKSACTFAALLLSLMIAAVIFNCIYVKQTAEHIISSLDELPEDLSDSATIIQEIAKYWNGRRKILNISLSKPDLNTISLLFDELTIAAQEEDAEEYKRTMARLKRAIEDIRELEELTIENIF